MRRCTNVAAAVVAESATTRVVVASRSLAAAGAFTLPERCDVLKLPVFAPLGDDASGERRVLAEDEDPAFNRLRSRLLLDLVAELRPRAILVDNEPRGLGGEMLAALTLARREGLVGRIVCGLRDIRGRPAYVIEKWQRDGTAQALAEFYDAALVYGDPAFLDTRAAYGLGTAIPIDVVETGYLFESEPGRSAKTVRAELAVPDEAPIVAVTAGSGADGGRLLEAYASLIVRRLPADVVSILVAGPLMPAAEFEALRGATSERCRVVRRYDNVSLVAAASAVVCQGGYNSMCEAVHLGRRPLVVPRLTRSGEQELRADVFARRDLCDVLRPDPLDAAAAARSIVAQLERRPATTSPFHPAESAAKAARALLD
jgi:predicted glycosyltransferase